MTTNNDKRHEVSLFLTVTEAGLEIHYGGEVVAAVRSTDELAEAFDSILSDVNTTLAVEVSSSLDFPREHTDDKDVIELCRVIRI